MSRPLPISRLEKYLIQKNRGSATGRNLVCMLESKTAWGTGHCYRMEVGAERGLGSYSIRPSGQPKDSRFSLDGFKQMIKIHLRGMT